MKLSELLANITYQKVFQLKEVEIENVQTDSRKCLSNDVFVCLQGEHVDGHDFINKAVENGTKVVIIEKEVEEIPNVTYIFVPSTYRALAQISSVLYNFPSKKMKVIGVTGTNGKTSVTQFLNQIYRLKGYKTGLLGTIHIDIDGEIVPTNNTTPFAHDLQRTLFEMEQKGVSHVFMEVSSHGLAMGRVWGCEFTHGVFTNLSQDHLDYHKTMEEYKRAKGILFTSLGNDFNKTAVLNADDEVFDDYCSVTGCNILSYGIRKNADLKASNISSENGLSFTLTYKQKEYKVQTKLAGDFHVYNLMAAMSICLLEGWTLEEIIDLVSSLEPVKGRMENIECGQDFQVIVDYAHTPDGLENALRSVRGFAKGRIITLIGCGGNRDKTKRPIMAKVAEDYSDFVYLTSDNPRKEDPEEILRDMEVGMTKKDYSIVINRAEAIEQAIHEAKTGDVILIAGKGHEDYQIIGETKNHFSDKEEAEKGIRKRLNAILV